MWNVVVECVIDCCGGCLLGMSVSVRLLPVGVDDGLFDRLYVRNTVAYGPMTTPHCQQRHRSRREREKERERNRERKGIQLLWPSFGPSGRLLVRPATMIVNIQ